MNTTIKVATGTSGDAAKLYAMIHSLDDADGVFRSSAGSFEAFSAGSLAQYAIPVTEVGSLGVYSFAIPAPLRIVGRIFEVVARRRPADGGVHAQSDPIVWSRTVTVGASLDSSIECVIN